MHKWTSGLLFLLVFNSTGFAQDEKLFFVRAPAKNAEERGAIANLGVAIDGIFSDSVTFIAKQNEVEAVKKIQPMTQVEPLPERFRDFPKVDEGFHNYERTTKALDLMAQKHPNIASRITIGKSVEGRGLEGIRIAGTSSVDVLPTAILMGCHHAREHLSVEIPLGIAQYLVDNYATNPKVKDLVDFREIYIIPMVNPDGAEYDISGDKYKYWRKNRRDNKDGTFGVDLNRNYGPKEYFGGPGTSNVTMSDVYPGPNEFSEPETQAVRDFMRAHRKTTVFLSFHSFSELVLWPFGHTTEPVPSKDDSLVFAMLANKMASWNHYKPMKSSSLYLNSGDTMDWAYSELKIFGFTFELSPNPSTPGNFYPGVKAIEPTIKANIDPVMYLIDHADNPYRVLKEYQTDPLGVLK